MKYLKRKLSILLVFGLVLSYGTYVNAQDNSRFIEPILDQNGRSVYEVDDLHYQLNTSKKTATLVGTTLEKGKLNIPSSVKVNGKTYKVTKIGFGAFRDCSGLKGDLKIPSSVTQIGNQAFMDCYNLNGTLTVPKSVKKIGEIAFQGCFFNKINYKSKCKYGLGFLVKSKNIPTLKPVVNDFYYCYVDKSGEPCIKDIYIGDSLKDSKKIKCGYGKGPWVLKINKKFNNTVSVFKEHKKVNVNNQGLGTLNASCQCGVVTYKKVSGNKNISVSKDGLVTVKNLNKGTYSINVRVTSPKSKAFKSCKKDISYKIVVK